MNSDPYDSAAWRAFGMLEADESAILDEAMRQDPVLRSACLEMDRLSAAIGAASVAPVEPRAGQLTRLQNRLGLYPVRRLHVWMGLSGWAAAAALALLMVFTRYGGTKSDPVSVTSRRPHSKASSNSSQSIPATAGDARTAAAHKTRAEESSADVAQTEAAALAAVEEAAKANATMETKRLIQEIEVLRDNLANYQQHDRVLFEAVPGVAVPIVMTMHPPGVDSDGAISLEQTSARESITAMLGDALRLISSEAKARTSDTPGESIDSVVGASPSDLAAAGSAMVHFSTPPALPSAVPIYDAARDTGTLVVSNLPHAGVGNGYNLWVHTADGTTPIYVGSLPEGSSTGNDLFDFSLGSTNVLPSGFVLTKDKINLPTPPSASNTVLQGPSTKGR